MALAEQESSSGYAGISELYRRHARWLTAAVRHRGGGEASEDIVQEAYLRVARLPSAASVRHPKALLLHVARNLMRNANRDAARHAFTLGRGPQPMTVAAPDQFELVALKEAVLNLPEVCRDVFILSRIVGMTYEEIARASGISVKTVEWRMSKALSICAARLNE